MSVAVRVAPHPPVSPDVLANAFQVLADRDVGTVNSWSLTRDTRRGVRPNLIFRVSGLMTPPEIASMLGRSNEKGGYELSGPFRDPVDVGAGRTLRLCMGFDGDLHVPQGYRTVTLSRDVDDPPVDVYLELLPETVRSLALEGDPRTPVRDVDWAVLARSLGGLHDLHLTGLSNPLPAVRAAGCALQTLLICHERPLHLGHGLATFPLLTDVALDAPTVTFGTMPRSMLFLSIDAAEVYRGDDGDDGILDLRDCAMLLRVGFDEGCSVDFEALYIPSALVELRLNAAFSGDVRGDRTSLHTVHASIEYPYMEELGDVPDLLLYDL